MIIASVVFELDSKSDRDNNTEIRLFEISASDVWNITILVHQPEIKGR